MIIYIYKIIMKNNICLFIERLLLGSLKTPFYSYSTILALVFYISTGRNHMDSLLALRFSMSSMG